MRTDGAIACFGEIMLRLAAPDSELLLQSARLAATFGGAEANVAVSLARLGHDARMVGVLADNAIGAAARDALRQHGVNVAGLRSVPGRMGLYFLTPGSGLRPSQVLYDRAGSAFAVAAPDAIDWDAALSGVGWLHLSGVTPAIGASTAAAAVRAAKAARRLGVTLSFDGNYRASLWQAWDGDGPAILGEIVSQADVMFGDHRDVALILGRPFAGEGEAPRSEAAAAAFAAWPNLQAMASTRRVQHSADHNDLSGFLFTRAGAWTTRSHALIQIVDRIGGGDAFAAGVIHGLRRGLGEQRSVEFGLAAAALKHAIPGDFNLSSVADVERLMGAEGLDVRR
jgi:2-dehydro-3-deoxygluconokinase